MKQAMILCPLLALFFVVPAWSEKLGSEVHIDADSFDFDQDSGTSIYKGNAVLQSGDVTLSAGQIEILSDSGALKRILATSGPSRLQKVMKNGKILEAEAQNIELIPAEGVIYLRGKVRIEDPDHVLLGGGFEYNINNNTFKSIKGSGRTRMKLKTPISESRQKAGRHSARKTKKPVAENARKTQAKVLLKPAAGKEKLRKVIKKTTVRKNTAGKTGG